jgi:hydrogenase maturation protease
MRPVLVVGYGNALRGDDGAGRLAAQALAARWPESEVRVESAHQLLVEIAADLAECGYAVFVDAARDGAPGGVSERALRPAPGPAPMTHHATPEGLLAAAAELYGRAPEAALFTVAGADFGPGERLSPPVAAALPDLVKRVAARVDERLARLRGGETADA